MSKTLTSDFITEKNKAAGAKIRTLLEIDTDSSTLNYSDQAVIVDSKGVTWTIRTSAANNAWEEIIFGNDLFVAVAASGSGNRVMTSPEGANWTIRASAADNQWRDVAFGNNIFVAISSSGTNNHAMTSPDGVVWTIQTTPTNNSWNGIAFGNGLFVAVAVTGTGNRVMTSPDGATWTIQTSAADNNWRDITFANGLFVAVASSGVGNRVMTSPDGATWTIQSSAADNDWEDVAFGAGLFVAVASSGVGNRVMTSPDGVAWTIRTSAADNQWRNLAFGNSTFVAVADTGSGNRVMTSPDGVAWTIQTSAANNSWNGVAFGNSTFVAVASSGVGNRVMTSSTVYTANVMAWPGRIRSQIRPGEEVVRISSAAFEINNNPRIDDDIRAGLEVRVYLWFESLTTADKLLWFKGIITENIGITAYRISFTAMDIGDWFDKQIGIPLDIATYPSADPDDIGKIQPILYGDLTDQPCLAIEAGAVSTLVDGVSIGDVTALLTNANAFPASGTILIGDIEVTYTGVAGGTTLTGIPGAGAGSFTADFPRSTVVSEKVSTGLKWMVAGHVIKAITNPRFIPTGQRVESAVLVAAADITLNINDGGIATAFIAAGKIDKIRTQIEVSVTQQQTQNSPAHLHTNTISAVVERRGTGIFTNQGYANPTNAFDGSDDTFAASPLDGVTRALVLTADTTNLGTITTVTAVVRSQVNSGTARILLGWTGAAWEQIIVIGTGLATRTFVTTITDWARLTRIGFEKIGAGSQSDLYEIYYVVEYTSTLGTTAVIVAEVLPSVVGGNSVADTLGGILIVNAEGYPDNNPAHYTDVADSLIEEPWDVIHHILENHGNGVVDADIDLAGSFQDAEDNLPASYKFAFSIRQKITMNRLLAMLAQQTWCRFIWEAGIAKLNRIKLSGASIKSIDTDTDSYLPRDDRRLQVTKSPKGLNEIFNDIEVKYDLNYTLGNWGTPDAFEGSSEDTDAASIALYKIRQRTWLMFAIGDNSTMADDVRDKLLEFYQNPRATVSFPGWLKNVELERGDVPDLVISQLGINQRLYEVIGVDLQVPHPVNRQRPELMFSFLDLLFVNLIISDSLSISESVVKAVGKILTEPIALAEAVVLTPTKIISEELPMGDGTEEFLADGDHIADGTIFAIGLLGSFVISVGKGFSDTLSISEVVGVVLNPP